jgi:heme oxygenase
MISIADGCSSVRDKLRETTAGAHAELDGVAETLLSQGSDGYSRFLAALGAVIIPLEKRLEMSGIENVLPDWSMRARRYNLKADLRELARACEFVEAPAIRAPAELLGAAYVLEGSRLGASLLLRALRPSTATRFLRHGQCKGLWPSFLGVLETNADVRLHFDQTRAAAVAVFGLFIRAMNSVACVPAPIIRAATLGEAVVAHGP